MTRIVPAFVVILLLLVTACAGRRALDRKMGPRYEPETQSWLAVVRAVGGTGMWIVSRGYHTGDDFVAIASNASFSHTSILDLERSEVIEAVAAGVVVTPLDKYLRETHRLRVVRPRGWTAERGTEALARARSKIGAPYDYLGIVGVPDDDRFYCSELAAWSMGIVVDRPGPHRVLHPKKMHELGEILFDSGDRDGAPDEVAKAR